MSKQSTGKVATLAMIVLMSGPLAARAQQVPPGCPASPLRVVKSNGSTMDFIGHVSGVPDLCYMSPVRLRKGVEFQDGRPLRAEDAIASLQRIIDPKRSSSATSLADIDPSGFKRLDDVTFSIQLKQPNGGFDTQLGQYGNGIVPADYDPAKPVGTGPFKFGSFVPGDRTVFPANKNYWRTGLPYVDELVIIDFPDETARINALLSGQVHAIDNVPFAQTRVLGVTPGLKTLVAKTGAWLPFTMRVDQAPFSDVRVRQAMRLIVDRQQMIDQALSGLGALANDLYSPYDPAYASDLPQRHQDIDQAKSLLRMAGHSDLAVELVTAPVAAGVVEAAQVFAEQAKAAGVNVSLRKVDTGVFYGNDYLKWTFSQDFWFSRDYLPQTAVLLAAERGVQRDAFRPSEIHCPDHRSAAHPGCQQAQHAAA